VVDDVLVTFSDRRYELRSFYSEFSCIEDGDIAGLEVIDITLIDNDTKVCLICKFRVCLDGGIASTVFEV
jgi:hypothetical protein